MRSNAGAEFVFRFLFFVFLTLNPVSGTASSAIAHLSSPARPAWPRPELFIRLGEVTHTHLLFIAHPWCQASRAGVTAVKTQREDRSGLHAPAGLQ